MWRARYEQGLILTIEEGQRAGRPVAVVRNRAGKELFRSQPARESGVYELRDLTLCGPRCLAVSAFYAPAPGQGTSAIFFYAIDTPGARSRAVPTGDRVCRRLAGEPGGGLWCLGPDLRKQATGGEYPLVRRFSPEGKIAGEFLSSGPFAEPLRRAASGEPALECGRAGEALVWLPAASLLAVVDAAAGNAPAIDLPVRLRGRSRPTFAVTALGTTFALLPHVPPGEEENLGTRYRLFRKERASNRWAAVAAVGDRPRGTELIGWDRGELVLWNRTLREVEWVTTRE